MRIITSCIFSCHSLNQTHFSNPLLAMLKELWNLVSPEIPILNPHVMVVDWLSV